MVLRNPAFPPGTPPGTVTTPSTTVVEEHARGNDHFTKLTMTNFAVGTIPDNASLAFGAKFYEFPAGTILIENCAIRGGITGAVSVTAQAPECGIGTTVGVGAIAALTTTMEDIIDGGAAGVIGGDNTPADIAGTVFYKGMVAASAQGVIIKASGGKARELYLNLAKAWSDVAAPGAATFTGTIWIRWSRGN